MEPENYKKLPSSLRTVNITGGEPFLRKDLVEVVRNIHSSAPSCRLVFSTNGMLTDTIVETIEAVRTFHNRIGVGVSIDGPEEVHDAIRGVSGSFKNAVRTVRALRSKSLRDLRIGMTLVTDNYRYAEQVYRLSKDLGVEFTITFAHNSEIYFQKTDNPHPEFSNVSESKLKGIVDAQLMSFSAKDWFRAYHVQGITSPDLRREFISRCQAGTRFFFVAPYGEVYPCMVMNMPIGNLREARDWDSLFDKDKETRIRRAVRNCREDCWMVCNTRSLIISQPLRAGLWVARNKLRLLLR